MHHILQFKIVFQRILHKNWVLGGFKNVLGIMCIMVISNLFSPEKKITTACSLFLFVEHAYLECMQQITKCSLDHFTCEIKTELPFSTKILLDLANGPSIPCVTAVWNEFVDYSTTAGKYAFCI